MQNEAGSHTIWILRGMIAIAFVAIVAPTTSWLDFYNAEEAVNVATAIEIRRDGNWKIPTLNGVPRLVKPPMEAWITAASISPATLQAIDSSDVEIRDRALRDLARQVRWHAMLCALIIVLSAFELGRAVGSVSVGLIAALMTGTNFLLLRHAQLATTDIQLATWVSAGVALLAHAILRDRRWCWAWGGLMLGIASLSKGPALPLLQAVAPMAAWVLLARRSVRRNEIVPILIGIAAMILIALPWYVWVLTTVPGVWDLWWREVTRYDANKLVRTKWYRYFALFYFWFPWVIVTAPALVRSAGRIRFRVNDPTLLPMLATLLPLLVMCFFRERMERYMVPLIAPAMTAGALLMLELLGKRPFDRAARYLLVSCMILMAALAIGLPLLTTTTRIKALIAADGGPWLTPGIGYSAAVFSAAALLFGWLRRNRAPFAPFLGMVVAVATFHVVYTYGLSRDPGGMNPRRPLADRLLAAAPNAEFHLYGPPDGYTSAFATGADLQICLNRTMTWTPRPQDLPQKEWPIVLCSFRSRSDPPLIPPAGYQPLISETRGKTVHEFFILLPIASPLPN